jgi:hypothetical protein
MAASSPSSWRHLQPLDEVGRAHEQHAPAALYERQTEHHGTMALAPWAEIGSIRVRLLLHMIKLGKPDLMRPPRA